MFLENKVIYVIGTDHRSFRITSAQDQRRSTISAFPSQKSSRVRIQITKKLSARWRGATNNGKVSLCDDEKNDDDDDYDEEEEEEQQQQQQQEQV